MKINNEIIEKFQKVYFEEFKEKITKQEAHDKFLRLVNLLRTILKTSSKKDQDVETPGPSSFD
jgi:hypothetical protein